MFNLQNFLRYNLSLCLIFKQIYYLEAKATIILHDFFSILNNYFFYEQKYFI